MHVKLDDPKKYNLDYKTKIKILNKRAENFQAVNIYYKQDQEKIKNVEIKVYNKEGRLIKSINQKAMQDYASYDGYSMIFDRRVLNWTYLTNDYPITIEYEYQKTSKNTIILPVWHPIKNYNVSVLESLYSIETKLATRELERNLNKYHTISKTENGYSMKNQRPLKKEKFSEPEHQIFPLFIDSPEQYSFQGYKGEFTSWNGFSKWMYDSFLKNKILANQQEIKAELDLILKDKNDKREIAKNIYEYVQDNTRYVSISLEEGGLSPMDPSKVHEVKYGDCKALSFYTKSLLDLYDIQSNYVVVHASANAKQDLIEDYPSTYPGNHIIINVPLENDTIWIDCTSGVNPFGFLGSFTDDRLALEVNEDRGKLIKTPAYFSDQNSTKDTIRIKINDDYSASIDMNTLSMGLAIENDLHIANWSKKEIDKYYKSHKKYGATNLKVENHSVEVDSENISSRRKTSFTLASYAEMLDEYLLIPLDFKQLTIPKLIKNKHRKNKINFERSYSEAISYFVTLPESCEIINDLSIKIENNYGSYSINIEQTSDSSIKINKAFNLYEGLHEASKYEEIKNFFDRCIKSEKTTLQLLKL